MNNVSCDRNIREEIEIILPDDFHHHFRDGNFLIDTVYHSMQRFGRVAAMPNTKPPIQNKIDAHNYFIRIMEAYIHNKTFNFRNESFNNFQPLMTLYLTDKTSEQDIIDAKIYGVVACKLYPMGVTTNSDDGVTNFKNLYPIFEVMSKHGIILQVHCEDHDKNIDIFDRESMGIQSILQSIIETFPDLKVIMEHITTEEAIKFVNSCGPNVAATITAHHLLYNRNDLLSCGIKPHIYCLPILKSEKDRKALLEAATSGNPKFFLGTDSAPHSISDKENACGCAGVFTGHAAIELYAEAFDSIGKIDKLEGFSSIFGAQFYGLPLNKQKIKLIKTSKQIPDKYDFGNESIKPLRGGEFITWAIDKCHYSNK